MKTFDGLAAGWKYRIGLNFIVIGFDILEVSMM
jgi:hypothetical protein